MSDYFPSSVNNQERESFMAEIEEFRDLCSTCNYAVDCLKDGERSRPIWFCEEFDCFTPSPAEEISSKSQKNQSISFRASKSAIPSSLCMSCENLQNCLFFVPSKKVLHCEEYQ